MNWRTLLSPVFVLSWTIGLAACSSDSEQLPDGGSVIECTSNAECDAGEICFDQVCLTPTPFPCTSDTSCEGELICEEGACVEPECSDNVACEEGFTCEDGRCEEIGETPCEDDSECSGTDICIAGVCEPATVCVDNNDCANDLICIDSICREPCTQDSDCGSPLMNRCDTDTGLCQSRCLNDNMCPQGEYCESNICVPAECTMDSECNPPGEICEGADEGRGRCVEVTPCGPNGECPTGSACDTATNRCEPLPGCRTDRDCGSDAYCEDGFCQPTQACTSQSCPNGFECVAEVCVPAICRADSDCTVAGEICVGGICQAPPTTDFVTSVRIITPAGFVRPGSTYAFVALAQDQAGRVVPGAQIDWTSSSTTVATIAADGLATGETIAGLTQIRATVQSSIGPVVSQPVNLTNLGPAPATGVRVTVVRQDNGAAISGATVLVEAGAPGVLVTDSSGTVSFPNAAAGAVDITVVHPNFDWVTVLQSASQDVRIELPALNRTDRAAGGKGTVDLSQVSTQGALSLSLSGASLASPLLTSDPGQIFGGDLFNAQVPMLGSVPVPAGNTVSLEFMGFPVTLKDTYYARAQPGLRALWSFGGKVDFGNAGLGAGDLQNLLAALLPFYQRFEHTVDPTVPMLALPTVVDSADVDGDGDTTEMVPDWTGFASRTLTPSHAQTLRYQLTVDNLPFVTGGNANTLVVMSGVILPGVGFVPLGLDGQSDGMGTGIVPSFTTKMAPPHSGLEVGEYAVLAAAIRTDMGGLPGPGSVRLFTANRMPAAVDLSGGWLDAPVNATVDLMSRQANLPSLPTADLYHVAFANEEGTWHVYTPSAMGPQTITVPVRPDLMLASRMTDASVTVDAVDLEGGVNANTLFDAAASGALGLDRATRGFARAIVR